MILKELKKINKFSLAIILGMLVLLSQFVNCAEPIDVGSQAQPTEETNFVCEDGSSNCTPPEIQLNLDNDSLVSISLSNGYVSEESHYSIDVGGICNVDSLSRHSITWGLVEFGNAFSIYPLQTGTKSLKDNCNESDLPLDIETICDKGTFNLRIPFVKCFKSASNPVHPETGKLHSFYVHDPNNNSNLLIDDLTSQGISGTFGLTIFVNQINEWGVPLVVKNSNTVTLINYTE
ncbi:MAG: hypothetical protein HOO06_10535 [Bdellovibrionaceae bacterium]|nr:hypothetical protein [Pseudobdellovibrionaceae bacterium]